MNSNYYKIHLERENVIRITVTKAINGYTCALSDKVESNFI